MSFCKRCFTEYMLAWDKKKKPGQSLVDPEHMIFKCQIPIFDHDAHGETRIRLWDCKEKKYIYLTKEAYQKRKRDGKI